MLQVSAFLVFDLPRTASVKLYTSWFNLVYTHGLLTTVLVFLQLASALPPQGECAAFGVRIGGPDLVVASSLLHGFCEGLHGCPLEVPRVFMDFFVSQTMFFLFGKCWWFENAMKIPLALYCKDILKKDLQEISVLNIFRSLQPVLGSYITKSPSFKLKTVSS